MEKLMLTIKEFTEAGGPSRTKAYEMAARGEIPVVRFGRAIRIPVDAARRWIEASVAGAQRTAAREQE